MEMVALSAAQQLADDVDAWGMPVLRALLPVAGMTVIEQQAERARAIGARRLLVLVDGVPAGLVEACDRIRARGMPVDLVRDNAQVHAHGHAAQQLLLIADGLIAGDRAWAMARAADAPALLTVPDDVATRDLERIDAGSRWAGLALLPGSDCAALEQAPPDWDPQLTLLRHAIQTGVPLLPCDRAWFVSGEMQLAANPIAAAAAEDRLLSDHTEAEPGIADRWLWGPLLRLSAPRLLMAQASGKVARTGTLLLALTCGVFALFGQPLLMAASGVAAALCHVVARFVAQFRPESRGWAMAGTAGGAVQGLALVIADRGVALNSLHLSWGSGGMAASFAVLLGLLLNRNETTRSESRAPLMIADMTTVWLLSAPFVGFLGWRAGFDVVGIVALGWLAGQLFWRGGNRGTRSAV